MTRALAEIARGRRVVVCVGPGGVGKTTLAAALALSAADEGRRVALVTIDPARRLASALGLAGRIDDSLRAVPGATGLEAAMLETRASFDALVGRIAKTELERHAILDNRVYRSFSRTLARPHAYVAMERLHDLVSRGEHDLVVLDTPPTRSALDILDAPGRLARFASSGLAEAMVGALAPERGLRASIARRGHAVAAELLARLLGRELAGDLAGFFAVLLELRRGFAERAERVQGILRDPETAFVLVAAPDATHLEDAASLAAGLSERDVRLDALLSNRVARLGGEATTAAPPGRVAPVVVAARAYRDRVLLDDRARIARAAGLATSLGVPRHVAFPRLAEPPSDVRALRSLANNGEFAPARVSS